MINFGTVGTGWITSTFIEAAQLSKQLNLTSVYSRSEEKARLVADTYNASDVFTDIEEMAKSEKIEAVYIASPNSVHYKHALLFLKNKKHVICEKPIFSNTKELAEAHKTAEANGVFLFEAIRNIHTPNFNILKENLHIAGEIRSAILPYIKYSSRYDLFLNELKSYDVNVTLQTLNYDLYIQTLIQLRLLFDIDDLPLSVLDNLALYQIDDKDYTIT
jgi:predicted dehydrogenase